MVDWTVINIDKEKDGYNRIIGATYVMEVPGGMLVRTFLQTGVGLVFVPVEKQMTAAMWIDENKIEHK